MPVSIVDNSEVIPVRSKLSGLMYGTEEGRRGMAVLRGEEPVLEGQTAVISFDSKALKRMPYKEPMKSLWRSLQRYANSEEARAAWGGKPVPFTVNYVNEEIRIRRLSSPGQTSP
jgi:hypothetical protein